MTTLDIFLTLILGVVLTGGLYLIYTVWKNSTLQRRRILRAQQQIKHLRQDHKKKEYLKDVLKERV